MAELWICDLGLVAYADALALQLDMRAARQADAIADTLLLLEHPPVYTYGRRSGADELPGAPRLLGGEEIDVVEVDRGGRVTYHGPGQLVGYPIVRIGDVIGYLRAVERAIIAALGREGVPAQGGGERPTGVWTAGGRKIASLGVHVSRRVTTHGFAINADNDLAPFGWIVPCGLRGVEMTSVARETGRAGGTLPGLRAHVARELAHALGRRPVAVATAELIETASKALGAPVG
jgi:lipoyl(octanoyl) transferase